MLKTPVYPRHCEKTSKIVNFSGWALPLEYESILKEARCARTNCVLFDISHMGRFIIEGEGRENFLQKLTTNDISKLKTFSLQYNLFTTPEGTIIDDFIVYNLGDKFLCVVNASNREKDFRWLKSNSQGVVIKDETFNTAFFSLQGPLAWKVMQKVVGDSLSELRYMHFLTKKVDGIDLIISRSGYTGEDGFEIYLPKERAIPFWDLIMEKGKEFGLTLAGLGSRDILRIEAGYPLYGNDISESTNPFQASLDWVVKLKSKDFVGKESLVKILQEGIKRKRVGFIMQERGFPRKGYPIFDSSQEMIGEVTSGAYSPNLDVFIGMGYIKTEFACSGTPIKVKVRDKFYRGEVKDLPFIKYKYYR
ncbi:MAG: glycine cleavage system aminomethyltransferase GcvT [Candidatus Omnitrophota bacterium]|nr:MAG: glycine cleavage system aminomethyltransferase GcvT [Candidatus Omnitrophota bacterium]HDN86110.1 glycine cleavage system aminomethyltransferase GcvT [Candidatus Omnitrophota bacterium]